MQIIYSDSKRDIYLTEQNQLVEFDKTTKETGRQVYFDSKKRNHPFLFIQRQGLARGRYLRNGRIFTSENFAEKYLAKYLKHS